MPTALLSIDIIVELLPAVFEGWPFCQPSAPPTADSIARVQEQIGLRLPNLLLEVARTNASYGYWFNSIGDDYDSSNHILKTNEDFRARGVPDRYVVFAQGFDGECDAWDLVSPAQEGEQPIVFFHVDEDDEMSGLQPRFGNFHQYMDALVRHGAPQCPIDKVRRAAVERISEADRAE